MRKIVTDNRIEVFADIPGWQNMQSVIAFNVVLGKWNTASSMCMPSKISEAKAVMDAYRAAFDELEKKLNNSD